MGAVKKPENTPKTTDKLVEYFRGVWSELKKVHWPSRKQVIAYTGVVLVTVAIISLLLWIVDSGLTALLSRVL